MEPVANICINIRESDANLSFQAGQVMQAVPLASENGGIKTPYCILHLKLL